MKTRISAVGLALLVASTALGTVIWDNFTNGTPSPTWQRTTDALQTKEQNNRLMIKSARPGGGLRFSGYMANLWKIDFTRNYTVKIKYKLGNVSGLSGARYAAIGARVFPSGSIDEVRVQVRRDRNGLWVVYETYLNGELVVFRRAAIETAAGTLKARYVASADRLDISIDGVLMLRLHNFLVGIQTGNDLARVQIGALRSSPQVKWPWNRVNINRFRLSGTVVY